MVSKLSDLYELMVLEVPGCSTAIMLHQLKLALRRFCEETEIWREDLASIDIEEDEDEYILTSVYDADIARIIDVRVNTEDGVTNGDDGALISPSRYEYDPQTYTLTLGWEPSDDVTDGLDVKVVLLPCHTIDDAGMEETFINRWYEPIYAKALADLLKMPSKKWTNPELAGHYQSEYYRGVARARAELQRETLNDDLNFGA